MTSCLIALIIYIIGIVVYYLLNKRRIGTIEQGWGEHGPEDWNVDKTQITSEALVWPVILILYILFSPIFISEFFKRK